MIPIYETDNRFSPAKLRYFAPNFRCCASGQQTLVEIPDGWQGKYQWDKSTDVEKAVLELISSHGKRACVFEGFGDRDNGYCVPVEAWDEVMNTIVGVNWDKDRISDEEALAILRERK